MSGPEERGPGHKAALAARDAIEEVLLALPEIPLDFDRAGIRARMLRGIQFLYAALDSRVLATAHLEGLNEGATVIAECRALLERASSGAGVPTLDPLLAGLRKAEQRLRSAAEGVARVQLDHRTELVAGHADAPIAPARPFQASGGLPALHAFARRPLLPYVVVEPRVPLPAAAPAAPAPLPRPTTLEELRAFAEGAASGELEQRLLGAPEERAAKGQPPPLLFEPAIEEVELLRRVARDCLEDIANHRPLRKPNDIESWLDQEPFERRLLENLDAFAALGGSVLPMVSLFHAEAPGPDPERAFAAALTLGCIEGSDTVGAAVMTLKQSAPETYPGWFEGFWLASSPFIERAMMDLCTSRRGELVALALDVLHARGAWSDELLGPLLERREPSVRARLARALAAELPREEALRRLEGWLGEAADEEVTLAAAEALLRRGHRHGLAAIREIAKTRAGLSSRLHQGALHLLCLAGGPSDLDVLLPALNAEPSAQLLRWLGRFGHVEVLPALLSHLHHGDREIVAAAAEALDRITGASLREVVEEPWEVELPPEVMDAPGALPMPTRKVERVVTDPERWSTWLTHHARRFDERLKYRAGVPFTPLQIVAELEAPVTPPEAREEGALELALVTGLRFRFSPHDWVARQRQDLSELRSRVASLHVSPGSWSLGLARASARPPSGDPETITLATRAPAWLPATQTLPPASSEPVSLPFRRTREGAAPDPSSPEHPNRTLEQTAAADPHWDVVETAVAPLIPKSPELPFHPPELDAEDIEPEVRTAPVPLVPRGPALPFGPPIAPHREFVAAVQPSVNLNSPPGATTAPVLEVPKEPALPFQSTVDGSGLTPPPPPPPAPPTRPVTLSMPAHAHDSLEAVLPLAQYASLCAGLAVFPDAAEAMFRRYGLEAQEKRSTVDSAWRERLSTDPVQYEMWLEMYRRYHTYWTKRGSPPR